MRPFLLSLFLLTASIAEAVPLQLTQQGRILDSNGAAVTGIQDVTFRIYDAETGGSELWSETLTVSFNNGYYATVLGADEVNNALDSTTLTPDWSDIQNRPSGLDDGDDEIYDEKHFA